MFLIFFKKKAKFTEIIIITAQKNEENRNKFAEIAKKVLLFTKSSGIIPI